MTKPRERPWQDVLMENYIERERTVSRRSSGTVPRFQFNATTVFMKAVDAAARRLGYDRSSYIRRVLAIHVAHTLGYSLNALLHACPEAKPPPVPGVYFKNTGKPDTGEGIDLMCPHPGCDGEHLRSTLAQD